MCRSVVGWSIGVALLIAQSAVAAQPPNPVVVDAPGITVLTGLIVPEFEAEMQILTQALGVSCGYCHVRGNFASETNPRKAAARRMVEMTSSIGSFFPITSRLTANRGSEE